MRGATHLLFGLILAALFTQYVSFSSPLLAVILVLLGSVLPDIDERHSLLGRKIPIIGFLVKHRTFFHSILFLVVCVIALWSFLDPVYVLVFAAAFLSHLALDALTPAGVRPFWPSDLRIKGFVPVGSALEAIIFVAAAAIFVWLLL